MSEQSELITAASTGAAAAVAAVQDEQAEEERAEVMESATAESMLAADVAAERAEQAADAAVAATEAAIAATEQASVAGDTASDAAGIAYATQSELAELRQDLATRDAEMRSFLEQHFTKQDSQQPTEVVVTRDRTDSTSGNGDNSGSSGSATQPGNADRPRRHKFGRR